jgi:chloramphenicol 3-O-phosphotransferase
MSIDRLAEQQNSKNFTRLFNDLERWARENREGVIETTGTSNAAQDLVKHLRLVGVPLTVIQLHCDRKEWQRREGQRADRSPLSARVLNNPIRVRATFKIDTTGKTPEEIANECQTLLL